jgi:ABC-type multidrug transport system fused ATPase/permease subunit
MSAALKRYSPLLPAAAWREFYWLCLLAAASGLCETAGVASVIPFLAVLAQPDLALADPRIAAFVGFFGIVHGPAALALLGALVLLVLVATNAIAAMTTLKMLRFANRHGHTLAVRLLELYLRQPYAFILQRHTAELQKNVLSEVYRITAGILVPGVQMIAKSFVVLFLLIFLLVADPVLALTVGLILGASYFTVFRVIRGLLLAAGRESVDSGTSRARHAQESLSGFKEIKLLAREREFVATFAASSLRWADAQAKAQALAALPRYAVEIVAFGFVLAVAIYLLATAGTVAQVLPMLGLYAFAGYRLIPALEQVFAGWVALRYGGATLEAVLRDLEMGGSAATGVGRKPGAAIPFAREVALEGVGYRYPGAQEWAVRGLSLRIQRNASVAVVGPTGCGKTTVIDLLMGLLAPVEGRLTVDGAAIGGSQASDWQARIGHVSQQIFLCDEAVARNIAFGVPAGEIDMARVEAAARLARLHDFVVDLPQAYATVVGERGIRLSGGERQRIGIARALYNDPELLILDEATSALDNATESAVREALRALAGRKTVVMVAHRLSSVRDCDLIYVMEAGRIVAQGTYDELIASSPHFRALAASG